jgi:N-methylhydantoinase A
VQRKAWLGIDTGGTFTDLVLVDVESGAQWLHKTPTTPEDPSRCILDGMEQILRLAGLDASDVALLCHGTTLATNAVLERKWVPTGMITTAGFRDVIELARQRRPSFFNLDLEKPAPPASRDLRLEVRERIAHDGRVVVPLDEDGVREAVVRLRAGGAQAVSVCFLHAYANPAHERRAAEIVRELWQEAFVCTSSGVLAEFREYERFATATVNASLLPVIDRYLGRFEEGVSALGIGARPTIMQSNGGAVSPAAVRRAPINTFFSGPAGGVIGAVGLGAAADVKDIISFDMGGTSTDVALIRGGVPAKHNMREMGGFPVRTRTLDIHTIGAGGGSIAWVDPGGLLKVGPQSAGALPGPACYGRGGARPTVTDANMVLGRLNQEALLQGRMPVFPDLGRKAIEAELCERMGMDLVRAASGILEIVNVNMMGAVRVISVERGEDPRNFALMAFGGAGPLHAADVAAMMGIRRVLVPQRPGLLSAMGLINADARGDFSLTRLLLAEPSSIGALNAGLAELEQRGGAWLDEEEEGAPAVFEWQADLRYFGQNFELAAPLPLGRLDAGTLAAVVAHFHAAHEVAYGYAMPERPVEIVNLRLAVTVERPVPPLNAEVPRGGSPEDAVIAEREVWFAGAGFAPTPVYSRDKLPAGAHFAGPAVVEQMDTTTVIPPGARVATDRFGNLLIEIPAAAQGALQ